MAGILDWHWPGNPVGPGTAAVIPPDLSTGLVNYWKMDEASGSRVDSVGGKTLTDHGTVLSVAKGGGAPAGMPSTVALFSKSEIEYLDNLTMSVNPASGFSMFGWVYLPGMEFQVLFGLFPSDVDPVLELDIPTADNYARAVTVDLEFKFTGNTAPLSTATWHLIGMTYTQADKRIRIYVDGAEAATPSDPLVNNPRTIAKVLFGSTPAPSINCRMSSVGIWTKSLNTADITLLWSSGAGKFYPF